MLENKDVKLISLENIIPNRFQPRQIFEKKELDELADSIKQHGIIQPLILRKFGDKYEIIAGERRYKAAYLAGLYNVPAIIVEKNDDESAEIAIIENIQRKNLTPIEEAKSYKKLINKGLTQEEIAKKLGVTQPTIANKLRLLNLTQEVQDALLQNKISERHARSLLRLESSNQQIDMLNKIINEKINVKQTDEEIDKLLGYDNQIENFEIPIFEDSIQKLDSIDSKKIEVLNPFIESEEILNIDNSNKIETNLFKPIEEVTEDLKTPLIEKLIKEKNDSFQQKYSYLDTVGAIRKFIEKSKIKGFKLSSEEYDMDNEYQIIIKIEK